MDIRALAKTRAECAERVEALGMMNVSHDGDKRIADRAQYALAESAYQKAEDEYQRAISMLTTAELIALSQDKAVQP